METKERMALAVYGPGIFPWFLISRTRHSSKEKMALAVYRPGIFPWFLISRTRHSSKTPIFPSNSFNKSLTLKHPIWRIGSTVPESLSME